MSDNSKESSDYEFSNLNDSDPDGQIVTDNELEDDATNNSKDEMSYVLRGILQQQMATNEVSRCLK